MTILDSAGKGAYLAFSPSPRTPIRGPVWMPAYAGMTTGNPARAGLSHRKRCHSFDSEQVSLAMTTSCHAKIDLTLLRTIDVDRISKLKYAREPVRMPKTNPIFKAFHSSKDLMRRVVR